MVAVLDHLNIQKADFLGYSMGSLMGAHLLARNSDRFNSMVLGGIGNETTESAALGTVIEQALLAQSSEQVQSSVGKMVRQFAQAQPGNDLTALAYSAAKMWPEGYPLQIAGDGIGNAQFPVLVVNGEDDHPYVDSADEFVETLPNGKHVRLPGVDHLTAVADARFKKAVLDFLSEG